MVMQSVTSVTPFCYGYVVMQSVTPNHRLWYHWWYVYIFSSYGLWL